MHAMGGMLTQGAKTMQKDPQMCEQDMFLDVWSSKKNTTCCQRWLWCAYTVKGTNKWEVRVVIVQQCIKLNWKTRKETGRPNETAKQVHTNMSTKATNYPKKNNHTNEQKRQQKKLQQHKKNKLS